VIPGKEGLLTTSVNRVKGSIAASEAFRECLMTIFQTFTTRCDENPKVFDFNYFIIA
jgi:hypothetical protein